MASNMEGYACNFLEDPPDFLTRDPQQHGDCGKLFCKSCITKHSDACPHYRRLLSTSNNTKNAQEVKSLQAKCDNLDNGCQWVGDPRSLQTHLQICDYVLVHCTNKCKTKRGQTVIVLRKDLQQHLALDCPRRLYPCIHCGETGEYEERITIHIRTCPNVEVQCPNDQCRVCTFNYEMAVHRSICPFERVACRYAGVGCKVTSLRKDLKTHEEDDRYHLQIVTQTVIQQSRKISMIERKPRNTTPFKFKMTNYRENVREGYTFYSPPFYTSTNGYKMCIRVDAKGNGTAKGTHVSVFIHLMKGENDDSLTWPFTARIKIELLNQLEDKNHHTYTIPSLPVEIGEVSERVIEGQRGQGWGRRKFIPHSDLGYKRFKNCQYLRDDTLFFCVTVLSADYKPWLVCPE